MGKDDAMTPTPILTKREEPLGWLASTPLAYPLRFAVDGTTETEAIENFKSAVARWEAIPDEVR
jgi:hypothetical protein